MNLLSDAEIDGMALDHEGCVYLSQAEWRQVSAQAKIGVRVGEPVAWIEHHKGGDNLNWERVDHPYAKATPLYTAPTGGSNDLLKTRR